MSEITKCPIQGVGIKNLKVNADYRGDFIEVIRQDWNLMKSINQVSFATTFPGIIKAFHLHEKQNEVWFALEGSARIVLYDKRKNSKTKGKVVQIVVNQNTEKKVIFIPKGVAHGYQVLGNKPLKMVYISDSVYNYAKPDEIRIPFDSEEIGFDWSLKNK